MRTKEEFTKEEMLFIIRIADEGLENQDEDNKFEEIRRRALNSH